MYILSISAPRGAAQRDRPQRDRATNGHKLEISSMMHEQLWVAFAPKTPDTSNFEEEASWSWKIQG